MSSHSLQDHLRVYILAACGEAAVALSTSLPQPKSLKVRLLITPVAPFMNVGTLKPLFSHLSSCLMMRPVCRAHKTTFGRMPQLIHPTALKACSQTPGRCLSRADWCQPRKQAVLGGSRAPRRAEAHVHCMSQTVMVILQMTER